jgi:hypothetical protein
VIGQPLDAKRLSERRLPCSHGAFGKCPGIAAWIGFQHEKPTRFRFPDDVHALKRCLGQRGIRSPREIDYIGIPGQFPRPAALARGLEAHFCENVVGRIERGPRHV